MEEDGEDPLRSTYRRKSTSCFPRQLNSVAATAGLKHRNQRRTSRATRSTRECSYDGALRREVRGLCGQWACVATEGWPNTTELWG